MCLGGVLAFLFILGHALLAHLVPCWWVGWWLWRAGYIAQDTIHFIEIIMTTHEILCYVCQALTLINHEHVKFC